MRKIYITVRRLITERGFHIMVLDRIALIISIIGALNWGSIGLFSFDIVAWICGGAGTMVARIIYTVVALAGVWCISLLFRPREEYNHNDVKTDMQK